MAHGKFGLYDPRFERDACGVGLAADINGQKSHDILKDGLKILVNLAHRGACGCDPATGDGAGVLIQIPHDFLSQECAKLDISLPAPGEYGVGMVFLPPDSQRRQACEAIVEKVVADEGQQLLGWRDVPVDDSEIGYIARESQPFIRQVFVARGSQVKDDAQFDRKLYVIRKVIERAINELDEETRRHFYIPSLYSNRIVYKGLLMGTQLEGFYTDLSDPRVVSAFSMVHARFSTNTLGSWRLAHPYRLICHNGEINTLARQYQLDDRSPGHVLIAPLWRRYVEAVPHHHSRRQRHSDLRQRLGVASGHGPLSAPRPDDDDPGGNRGARADGPGEARLLRVPLLLYGALGRPGADRSHRRQQHWRGARPQRAAPMPLPCYHGRPAGNGLRDRRPGHTPGEGQIQIQDSTGENVPAGHQRGAHH